MFLFVVDKAYGRKRWPAPNGGSGCTSNNAAEHARGDNLFVTLCEIAGAIRRIGYPNTIVTLVLITDIVSILRRVGRPKV